MQKKTEQVPWSDFLKAVKAMIKKDPIPYVTRLANRTEDPEQKAFVTLVATVLSLRTKDKTTEETSDRLLNVADTPLKLSRLTPEKIAKLIYPAGFYKTKATQLIKIANLLLENHQGKVPKNLEDMIKLPGVGRKTANLVLTDGMDRMGICVDTHVHRILNRIGFLKTKAPDDTEMVLRETLPRRYWKKINLWLVMFGQYHCKPVNPQCHLCRWKIECPFGQSRD